MLPLATTNTVTTNTVATNAAQVQRYIITIGDCIKLAGEQRSKAALRTSPSSTLTECSTFAGFLRTTARQESTHSGLLI
jgi:hypothetical protein